MKTEDLRGLTKVENIVIDQLKSIGADVNRPRSDCTAYLPVNQARNGFGSFPSMRFLFPSDYFNPKQADAAYTEQFDRLQTLGFETSVISLEALSSGSAKIFPAPDPGSKLIYRGWMLSAEEYLRLVDIVSNTGANMWISHHEYLATHHLPNWYPLISDLTPETHCSRSMTISKAH